MFGQEVLQIEGILELRIQEGYIRYVARFAKHFGRSPEELGLGRATAFRIDIRRVIRKLHERGGKGQAEARFYRMTQNRETLAMKIGGATNKDDLDRWLITIVHEGLDIKDAERKRRYEWLCIKAVCDK